MNKPSRVLNDDNLFFGLDRNDIMAIGVVFYLVQMVLSIFSLEGFSLIFTGIGAIILMQIRLKFRRKIIRDTLRYFFVKIFWGGVYHDPKVN